MASFWEQPLGDLGKNIQKEAQVLNTNITNEVKRAGQSIETGVQGLGKNLEENFRRKLSMGSRFLSGKWNNLGQDILYDMLSTSTGGIANPDDLRRLSGEGGTERMVREAGEQAAAEEAATAAAIENKRIAGITGVFDSIIGARKRTPGRGATLLGEASQGRTILTDRGGSY